MSKRLIMSFVTSDGRSKSFYLQDPVENISATNVQNVMNAMKGVIVPSDWTVDRAAVIDTNTNELFNLVE